VCWKPEVRVLGGRPVHSGTHVNPRDLLDAYDAVVYANGAMRDPAGWTSPARNLTGQLSGNRRRNWYCGHPDVDPFAFTLDASRSRCIGVGNVAVDVARTGPRNTPSSGNDVSEPEIAPERQQGARVCT